MALADYIPDWLRQYIGLPPAGPNRQQVSQTISSPRQQPNNNIPLGALGNPYTYSGALNLFQGGAQLTGGGPVVHDDHNVNAPSATAAQQPFQPVAYTNEVASSFSGPAPTGLLTPQVGNRVYDPYSNQINAPTASGSFDPYAHLVSSSRGVFDVGYDIAPQGTQTR